MPLSAHASSSSWSLRWWPPMACPDAQQVPPPGRLASNPETDLILSLLCGLRYFNVLSAWRSASAPENSMSQATSATEFARFDLHPSLLKGIQKPAMKHRVQSKPRPFLQPWTAQTSLGSRRLVPVKPLASPSPFCRESSRTPPGVPVHSSSLPPASSLHRLQMRFGSFRPRPR